MKWLIGSTKKLKTSYALTFFRGMIFSDVVHQRFHGVVVLLADLTDVSDVVMCHLVL